MEELVKEGDELEWKETARWVKFEEDVEEGGNRWSKVFYSLICYKSKTLTNIIIYYQHSHMLPHSRYIPFSS